MKEKFKRIEAVSGLRKVLAFDSGSMDLVYASTSINSGLASALIKQLLELRGRYPLPVRQIIINFLESKMLLYSLKDYILILHVDESFSVQEMRQALKESPADSTGQSQHHGKDVEVLDSLLKIKASSDHLLVYQQIMERQMKYAQEKLGAFVAAKKLKESKEKLHTAYKLLQSFLVGKDGSVVFRNTPPTSVSMASRAIAAWALSFYKKCQEIVPDFPPDHILKSVKDMEGQWKGLGFAEAFREEKLVSDLDS